MDLAKITEWIKLPPRYLIAVTIALGLILFADDATLESVALSPFRERFKPYLGAAFIVSVSLVFSHALADTALWLRNRYHRWRHEKRARGYLDTLTSEEVELLRGYISGVTKTQQLRLDDGVVRGLEAMQIICRASSLGDHGFRWPYNIQPWAWKYLNEHPELLLPPDERA